MLVVQRKKWLSGGFYLYQPLKLGNNDFKVTTITGDEMFKTNETSSKRGMSTLGSIFAVLVIAFVLLLLYTMVTPFSANWKLANMLKGIASQSTNMETDEQIKEYAIKALHQQGYMFTDKEIDVSRKGRDVFLEVKYQVLVEIPLTDLGFHMNFTQDGSSSL